jgi:hypothetical protein
MSEKCPRTGEYMEDDPCHDRIYHMAKLLRSDGKAVSPLCAEKPRRINLSRELWTIRPEAVTCKRCLAILQAAARRSDD